MDLIRAVKRGLVGAALLFSLNGCGDECPIDTRPEKLERKSPWTSVLPECVAPESITTAIEGVTFYVPEQRLPAVTSFFSFLKKEFAKDHPRVNLLEEVVFYDPTTAECKEAYGEGPNSVQRVVLDSRRGETNGVNYILLNNRAQYTKFSFADQEQPVSDFLSFILFSPKGTLAHELAHILLEEKLLEMEDGDAAAYTSGTIACYEDEEHELVYRYAIFAELGYALSHPEEFAVNHYFNNTLLPVLEEVLAEDPELFIEEADSVEDFIASWSDILEEHLYSQQPHHDLQLAFFQSQKAIARDFPDLSYNTVVPQIEILVDQQQMHAHAVLAELRERAETALAIITP